MNKPIRSFHDLDVYQRSYKASIKVGREIVPKLPKIERFDLADQLRRSSKAVPRLIAEGYGKRHQKRGFQKYLDDAMAESNETQVGLCHIRDLYPTHIDLSLCKNLIKEYDIISRQLYSLRESWQRFQPISRSPSKPASQPKPRSHSKGITIIELLIVIAIIAIIGASTTPMLSNFLVRNFLRNKTNELTASLRTAQINSISGKEDSQWGVNISSSDITLFKGSSFASRDPDFDQPFSIPASINITNDEIMFDRLTGNPDSTATLSVSSNAGESNTVSVNEVGTVNVQ